MDLRKVIEIINGMAADGVVETYAIGGAVGATFYLEPVATFDLDVFVHVRADPASPLMSLSPMYDYLKARGGLVEGEHITIAGWPVQLLPPISPLVDEALAQAVDRDVEGTPARVFSAEHLAAISLQTGRAKDKARLLQFLEERALDGKRFESIVERHGLRSAWDRFKTQFQVGNA